MNKRRFQLKFNKVVKTTTMYYLVNKCQRYEI